jgi:single-strand DNA-binding protein
MQTIVISGRIGKDAETRRVRDNDVTSFNVAVDQGYGDNKTTNWFRVSAWGKKGAGAAPYLIKGGIVTVVGELEFDTYEGKPQYNIRATDFTLPAKQSGGEHRGNGGNTAPRNESPSGDGFDEDDIPFLRSDGVF